MSKIDPPDLDYEPDRGHTAASPLLGTIGLAGAVTSGLLWLPMFVDSRHWPSSVPPQYVAAASVPVSVASAWLGSRATRGGESSLGAALGNVALLLVAGLWAIGIVAFIKTKG